MPKITCNECRKNVVKSIEYPCWLSLMNFISFLYYEEQITKQTYEAMQNDLMMLKPWSTSQEEELEGIIENLEKRDITIEDVIKKLRKDYYEED